MSEQGKTITAAVLVIGDEILSGRTKAGNRSCLGLPGHSAGVSVVRSACAATASATES